MKRQELYETIAAEFELDGVLMDQTLLASDLGFDSLGMFDLVLFVEEIAGVKPEEQRTLDYPMMNTLGDAYAYWEAFQEHSRLNSHGTPIG